MKITKTAIDGMKFEGASATARDLRWDDELPGFGVRVWPSGKKTFFLVYRHLGRQRYLSIGQHGVLTLHQARELGRAAKTRVLSGKDPLEERQARNHGKTFGDLAAEYLTRHAAHKRSGKDDGYDLAKHVLPYWKGRPLASIRRADVALLHSRISEGAPIRANRVIALLSSMMNLAKQWGYLGENAANPAQGIKRNKEQARRRQLNPEEIVRLLVEIEKEPHLFVRAALKFYLLTASRKTEVLRLKWADVDFSGRVVTLRDTKNGEPKPLPLTTHLETLLRGLPRIAKNPYVFCGHRKGKPLADVRSRWEEIREAAKLNDVWIHDLRRTVATWLLNAGTSFEMLGRILDHSDPKVTQRHYARFEVGAVTTTLEAHGERLQTLLDGKGQAQPSPSDVVDVEPSAASR